MPGYLRLLKIIFSVDLASPQLRRRSSVTITETGQSSAWHHRDSGRCSAGKNRLLSSVWAQPGTDDSTWAVEGGHVGERTGIGLVGSAVLDALDSLGAGAGPWVHALLTGTSAHRGADRPDPGVRLRRAAGPGPAVEDPRPAGQRARQHGAPDPATRPPVRTKPGAGCRPSARWRSMPSTADLPRSRSG